MGAETFEWQTRGISDTSHMPPLSQNTKIQALVTDPHVQPVLDRWMIGWIDAKPATTAGGEVAYDDYCDYGTRGSTYNTCSGGGGGMGRCPITGGSTPTCNGMDTNVAVDVHQSAADLGYGYDGYTVDMCCTNGNFAQKTCADSGTVSNCGDASPNKCKPCQTVTDGGSCNVYVGVGSSGDSNAPNLLCENLSNYANCYCTQSWSDGNSPCDVSISNEFWGYMNVDSCWNLTWDTCNTNGESLYCTTE